MKNDNQKVLIIIIGGLLLLTSIIAFIMGSSSNKETAKKEEKEEPTVVTPILKTEISRLKDFDTFMAVQEVINNFYIELSNNQEKALLSLDESYVSKNNIDINNINEFITNITNIVNFKADEIYYNPDSNMTYYFIKGYIEDSNLQYIDNLFYLLKVDMENNYSITPLKDITDLEEYANDYYLNRIYIENDNSFLINKIEDVSKMNMYITDFKDLMNINSNKAYERLNDSTKSKYNDLKSFENDKDYISEKLFTKFDSINVSQEEDSVIYNLYSNNGDTIIITEYYPNDYKIDFNFLEISE